MGRIYDVRGMASAFLRAQRPVAVQHLRRRVAVAVAVARLHHHHLGPDRRQKLRAAGGLAAVVRRQQHRGLQGLWRAARLRPRQQRRLLRALNVGHQQGALGAGGYAQHARQGVRFGRHGGVVVLGAGVQDFKLHAVPRPALARLAARRGAPNQQRVISA